MTDVFSFTFYEVLLCSILRFWRWVERGGKYMFLGVWQDLIPKRTFQGTTLEP